MKNKWWKEAVVYQIYPRSFYDSNGDGIGDIQGIIEKLDYIKDLGVDVIWLSPVYQSPNDDNGYDISEYYDIMTEFGTMADFDLMLAEMKKRGLRLVMDLVANHTSDEHAWFTESRSAVDNPKRDYYIWRKGQNGTVPNNWQSFFGGDAWEHDPLTDEYYLHLFTRKQPDLNWENPEVRKEIYRLMRFWLDKGIDGFRMDVISLISKRNYEDSPYKEFNQTINKVYANGPRIHEFLQEMNQEVMSHYDMMTVGEGPGIDLDNGLMYVQQDRKELDMIFHFGHMFLDHGPDGKFDFKPYDFIEFKKIFKRWDENLSDGGWNSIFLGNHDFPRIVSRFGNDKTYWAQSAKALCLMLNSMRGTPYVYQGDEIGMTNVAFESIADYRDIETHNAYKSVEEQNGDTQAFLKMVHIQGRDNARTPVQWSDADLGGFTMGTPWINVNPNYKQINVASQQKDPDSILHFYRKMLAFRKGNPTLVYGKFDVLQIDHPQVFAFYRSDEQHQYMILVNFHESVVVFKDASLTGEVHFELGNYPEAPEVDQHGFKLRPWEAVIYLVR